MWNSNCSIQHARVIAPQYGIIGRAPQLDPRAPAPGPQLSAEARRRLNLKLDTQLATIYAQDILRRLQKRR